MMASENKQHSLYAGIVLLKLILSNIIQDISQTCMSRGTAVPGSWDWSLYTWAKSRVSAAHRVPGSFRGSVGTGWEQAHVGNVHTMEGKFARIVYIESSVVFFFVLWFVWCFFHYYFLGWGVSLSSFPREYLLVKIKGILRNPPVIMIVEVSNRIPVNKQTKNLRDELQPAGSTLVRPCTYTGEMVKIPVCLPQSSQVNPPVSYQLFAFLIVGLYWPSPVEIRFPLGCLTCSNSTNLSLIILFLMFLFPWHAILA